ncbi:MAG: mechanosensitive ion channel [Prochloraceae cyanobacterium]
MTYIIDASTSKLLPPLLAQIAPDFTSWLNELGSGIADNLGGSVLNILWAILTLVIGWIVALFAAGIVRGLLHKTDIDNKIATWITGAPEGQGPPIEKWIGSFVYWLVILFTIVAVLQTLQLEVVSQPLNDLLTQVTTFLPRIISAVILIGLAWLLATVAKLVLTRALGTFRLDERLNQQMGETPPEGAFTLSETLGNAVYWFIFLVFLPSILNTLGLEGTLEPVQALLDQILSILPNILAAVLIGAAGWLIAQVLRRVVTNLLAATGTDQIGERFGLSAAAGRQSLSWIIGTIVYVLILIPIAIAALEVLKIEAISAPAIAMLNQVLNILPKIFAASVVVIFAYVIGQYVAELVTNILTGIGFNNLFQWLGISKVGATPTPEAATEQPKLKTPSELVGTIVLIAIMLIATLTAVDILEIEALTTVVAVILAIAGQVLVGLIIFALGLYLANLAFTLITSSGTRQSKILGQTARIAIIILISAMALQQMGIAPNIVNLAFGLLVGGIAVAIALAFGLGGRDIAGEQVREWLDALKKD